MKFRRLPGVDLREWRLRAIRSEMAADEEAEYRANPTPWSAVKCFAEMARLEVAIPKDLIEEIATRFATYLAHAGHMSFDEAMGLEAGQGQDHPGEAAARRDRDLENMRAMANLIVVFGASREVAAELVESVQPETARVAGWPSISKQVSAEYLKRQYRDWPGRLDCEQRLKELGPIPAEMVSRWLSRYPLTAAPNFLHQERRGVLKAVVSKPIA